MTIIKRIVVIAAVSAFVSVSMTAAAQQRPYRLNDQQVKDLLSRIDTRTDEFRASFDRAIDRTRIDGEDQIASVKDFAEATDRLSDRVNSRRSSTADVEDVLRRASLIDNIVTAHHSDTAVGRNWQALRRELDDLARAYGVAWDWASSQRTSSRVDDQQVGPLLRQIEKNADEFRRSLDQALDRSRIDGSRDEDNIKESVKEFAESMDQLRDHFDRRQVVANDLEDVLRRGVSIDGFMRRHQLTLDAEDDWLTVRGDLDELARAYHVAWNWSNPRYTPAGRDTDLYHRLTGTYQLDSSRGDNPREAAEEAVRAVPSDKRPRTYESLINRLQAPDVIAIDRNENSVTIGSSRGQRATFEADGQVFTEQGPTGRAMNTRATFHGDQLMVTTTGNAGNDFTVTFEPIDEGRNLRVTRSIYDEGLHQPVTVRSFYRRSSDQAQWDLSARTQGVHSVGPTTGNFLVPGGTRVMVILDEAVSTESARQGDRLTMTTRNPSRYEGAVIEGFVSSVNASERLSGRAGLALVFESIRLRDGRTYQFAGVIESVRTPDGEAIRVDNEGSVEDENSQTEKTVQRGAIGAAVGAIIGAVAGGGSGAAIGAAIGAGGGAGTVIVEGRDQLDLPRGTELTIISSAPRISSEATGAQR
ncbi:MAG: hypothetical protein EHM89_10490 [Acidobacteria bacterium]|nr:MAG: hypothetical protein EHM89_10490 [Acidobacteriota bacterium]